MIKEKIKKKDIICKKKVKSMKEGKKEKMGAIILFTNPSARAGYDTRSIFKRSLTGLNSEFFLLLDLLPH